MPCKVTGEEPGSIQMTEEDRLERGKSKPLLGFLRERQGTAEKRVLDWLV